VDDFGQTLYHLSEDPGITRFLPRPSTNTSVSGSVVWAVDEVHLRNYLLPRDCPRVCFCPVSSSTAEDVERLMRGGDASAVVAIESRWYERSRLAKLVRYDLPSDGFECVDIGAGYFVSREEVAPVRTVTIDDPLGELTRRNVELRVLPSLWELRDRVIASTLQFSIIRWRNAAPRIAPGASARDTKIRAKRYAP